MNRPFQLVQRIDHPFPFGVWIVAVLARLFAKDIVRGVAIGDALDEEGFTCFIYLSDNVMDA